MELYCRRTWKLGTGLSLGDQLLVECMRGHVCDWLCVENDRRMSQQEALVYRGRLMIS